MFNFTNSLPNAIRQMSERAGVTLPDAVQSVEDARQRGLDTLSGALPTDEHRIMGALRSPGIDASQFTRLDAFLRGPDVAGPAAGGMLRVTPPAHHARILDDLHRKLRSGRVKGIVIDKHHRPSITARHLSPTP